MNRPDPKILDDLARVAGGAVNIFSGLQQQMRDDLRVRMEEFATRMDLVPREDFERLEAVVTKLRQRVDDLGKSKTKNVKPAPKKKAGAKKKR